MRILEYLLHGLRLCKVPTSLCICQSRIKWTIIRDNAHHQVTWSIWSLAHATQYSKTKVKKKSLDDISLNLCNLHWEFYIRILRQYNHLILDALQYICSFTVHQTYRIRRKLCTLIIILLECKRTTIWYGIPRNDHHQRRKVDFMFLKLLQSGKT